METTPDDRYHLEIYDHEDTGTALAMFSSDEPFLAIHVGDLIDPGVWRGVQPGYKHLRVTGVRHMITENEGVQHKICVYVNAVENATNYLFSGE